jgi:hypothetical protein
MEVPLPLPAIAGIASMVMAPAISTILPAILPVFIVRSMCWIGIVRKAYQSAAHAYPSEFMLRYPINFLVSGWLQFSSPRCRFIKVCLVQITKLLKQAETSFCAEPTRGLIFL